MTVYAQRISRIQKAARLSQNDVAEVVGASARTVARWAAGANAPRGAARQRLLDLAAVADQVGKVMTADAAAAWMHEPNPLLKHQRPVDLIAAGRYKEVLDLVDAIADGVFV